MSEWQTFFAMGGYAIYVWPSFAVSLIALLGLGFASWRDMRRAERLVALSEKPDGR